MTSTPHLAVMAAIDSMNGTIAIARALADSGRRIDLTGLDRDMAQLCAATMALGEETGRSLRPALEALLAEVNTLGSSLQAAENG